MSWCGGKRNHVFLVAGRVMSRLKATPMPSAGAGQLRRMAPVRRYSKVSTAGMCWGGILGLKNARAHDGMYSVRSGNAVNSRELPIIDGLTYGPGCEGLLLLSRQPAPASSNFAKGTAARGESAVGMRRGGHGLRLVCSVLEADFSPGGGRRRNDGTGTTHAGRVRTASGGLYSGGEGQAAGGGDAAAR